MFRSIMITFKQFLEEAKKAKPLYSEKEINKTLKKQGGIGAKAVQKYIDKTQTAAQENTN